MTAPPAETETPTAATAGAHETKTCLAAFYPMTRAAGKLGE